MQELAELQAQVAEVINIEVYTCECIPLCIGKATEGEHGKGNMKRERRKTWGKRWGRMGLQAQKENN